MSNPEINLEQKIAQEQHVQTEVLDCLLGVDVFIHSVKDELASNPNESMQISLVGETGVGKSVIAAQLIANLENDQELQEVLAKKGKRLKIWHISLARCLAELKKRGVITSEWGQFTHEEYAINSHFMADLLDMAEDYLLQDETVTPLIIFDAVSVTEFVDRGEFVMRTRSKKNHKVLAVVTDHRVSSLAGDIRDFLWNTDNPVQFMKILEKNHIKLDKEIKTQEELENLRFAMGNKQARERIRKEINDGAWRARERLRETNCPDFTLEELQDATKTPEELMQDDRFAKDPYNVGKHLEHSKDLRSSVLHHYYAYLLGGWGFTKDEFIIATNTLIQEKDVNYYVEILDEHALPIEEVLRKSEISRLSGTILNSVPESSNRVD